MEKNKNTQTMLTDRDCFFGGGYKIIADTENQHFPGFVSAFKNLHPLLFQEGKMIDEDMNCLEVSMTRKGKKVTFMMCSSEVIALANMIGILGVDLQLRERHVPSITIEAFVGVLADRAIEEMEQ